MRILGGYSPESGVDKFSEIWWLRMGGGSLRDSGVLGVAQESFQGGYSPSQRGRP